MLRKVLQREDLAPLLLAQSRAAARADAEAGPDAEAEAAADAGHVEDDQQQQYGVDERRDAHEGRACAPVARGWWNREDGPVGT